MSWVRVPPGTQDKGLQVKYLQAFFVLSEFDIISTLKPQKQAKEVFLNPYFYLINNKSPNYSGWETHKIQYGLKIIYVTLIAKEVDYDKEMIKTVQQPWYAYNSVKYEVKPNSYGIEEIWFIKDKGLFVVGDKLELWRVYS